MSCQTNRQRKMITTCQVNVAVVMLSLWTCFFALGGCYSCNFLVALVLDVFRVVDVQPF
ncbi:hypothetical protein C8R31_10747 [Nitrosospira sp. Nsp2]|nr:hypothetical protein C8R31_10747 [Nitrosospira sp. Nsp2]